MNFVPGDLIDGPSVLTLLSTTIHGRQYLGHNELNSAKLDITPPHKIFRNM